MNERRVYSMELSHKSSRILAIETVKIGRLCDNYTKLSRVKCLAAGIET